MKRISQLITQMVADQLTHVVLTPGASFSYLTGLSMHASERLTLAGYGVDGTAVLVLPELERDQVEATRWTQILSYRDQDGPTVAVQDFFRVLGVHSASIIGVEALKLRLFEFLAIQAAAAKEVRNSDLTFMALRLFKDPVEIEAIATAAQIVDDALNSILPALRVGMTERDVAADLEYQMRKMGSQGTPFATIVLSGPRGALPHGQPTDRAIQEGELLVLDYGAMCDGYAADTTRTLAFGDPGTKARQVYQVVQEAQASGIAAIFPGAWASQVDHAARVIIEDAGYGEFFTHRTGHGLGLDVHEFPSIGGDQDVQLGAGMVFTVEPGIYLPGAFGVRIEDDIVVLSDGKRVLTQFSKELLIL